MARTFQVYPQASIDAAEWTYILEGRAEGEPRQTSQAVHIVPAGVTAERSLRLLKVVFELVIADTDTFDDIDAAFFVDDIQPGPRTGTVWSEWKDTAEGIIAGLASGYTVRDFWAAWTQGDTQAMRNAANRALVSGPGGIGRGWTIAGFHQHEGDDSVTEVVS